VATEQSARSCDRCGVRLAGDNTDMRCSSCRRSSALKPPVVPRDFWNTTQMQHALATRHIGRVIYVYRTHPWHGRQLSQDAVGGWLNLTQPQLSRIESGRAIEDLGRLIRYARALGIPRELLWFKLPYDAADERSAGPVVTVPALVNGQAVLLPIDADAARAQGLGALIDQAPIWLDELPFPMQLPQQQAHAVQILALDDVSELEQLATALDDARRYLDSPVVGLFRKQLDRSKAADGDHGAAKALPLVLGVLGAISQHVRDVKPAVRRELLSLGADGAEFAGWLYRDLRDHGNASFWYDRAMEWAQAACDTAMQGYVLLKKSQMAYEERDAHLVMTFAEAAHQGPWDLPPTIQSEVIQQHALSLAMTGEPISVVEQEMDAAREALIRPATENGPEGAAYYSLDILRLRQAVCYTEAGKPARAAVIFDEVLLGGRLSRRDVGFFGARRATALALSGEPDEAAQVGLQACEIARDTNSERTVRILTETVQALKPWGGRPGPRAFRQAVLTNPRLSSLRRHGSRRLAIPDSAG
jgi:transcriptional regulator with XRE-family HTH domain